MNQPTDKQLLKKRTGTPLLDVVRSNEPLRESILAAVANVLDSGRYLYGPDCGKLERSVADICAVEHAVGCASGSDALLLSLMALGVEPGDEVITPSFTFFATASAVWRLGACPVFVDIDPVTFNMDPELVEAAITRATRAIIPVHLFGQCADMDSICEIAQREGLGVVEDAAQAIGAKHQGRPAGGWGDIGCFSFYPTKNLGGVGDGGMLTTGDAALADKLRLLASHGMQPRYFHSVVGVNSRLDSVQAAVLNVKLELLAAWNAQRQRNAERYEELFSAAGLDHELTLPQTVADREHVWNQYTIRVPNGRRDALRAHLTEREIGSETYYPLPLHLQECFGPLGYRQGSLPETERAAREVLSLPIFPGMTILEQEAVVDSIAEFYASRLNRAA
jgi:dTDP-4-amino-4,6-dideoxygalactose transaminase